MTGFLNTARQMEIKRRNRDGTTNVRAQMNQLCRRETVTVRRLFQRAW